MYCTKNPEFVKGKLQKSLLFAKENQSGTDGGLFAGQSALQPGGAQVDGGE